MRVRELKRMGQRVGRAFKKKNDQLNKRRKGRVGWGGGGTVQNKTNTVNKLGPPYIVRGCRDAAAAATNACGRDRQKR